MCDSGPDAPDPYATAAAQGTENRDSALYNTTLSRPNINSPIGNLSWVTDPNDPTKQTANWNMDPGYLEKYKSSSSSGGSSSQTSTSNSSTAPTPIDNLMYGAYQDILPRLRGNLNIPTSGTTTGANIADIYNNLRAEQTNLDPVLQSQGATAAGAAGLAGSQVSRLGQLYGNDFNYNGVVAAPEASNAVRQGVEDSLYSRATSRLDPAFQQRTSDQNSALAAQGITQGSQAYDREVGNLGRERTDAYANARNDAVANSTTEMKKLFDMGMSARQQGVGEANTLRQMPTQEALAAQQLSSGAGGAFNQTVGSETGQQAVAGSVASQAMQAELARNAQQFSQGNYDKEQLLDTFKAMRSGGQSSLASSTSESSGSSSQGGNSTSYNNLPNFFGVGSGAGTAGAAPIASLIQGNYDTGVANSNATNAGVAGLAGNAMMAAAMGLT